jgi:L-amino acid N-acyltransferase YncA
VIRRVFLRLIYVEKETVLYAKFISLYEQKSNAHHSIEVSLKIDKNKLQERIQSDCYQTTRPYPIH